MRITQLFLAACLLAFLGCDIGDDIVDLDTEPLTVSVTTVGANVDANGYLLSVSGQPDERIGVNESKIVTVLRIDVTVELQDIAANCAAADNPQTVSVRGPTSVSFFVECS